MKRTDIDRMVDEELYLSRRRRVFDNFELVDSDLRTIGELTTSPTFKEHMQNVECLENLARLRKRFPGVVGARIVTHALVAPNQQGRGYGNMLYEEALKRAAEEGYALAPDSCDRGATSPNAERVWEHLKRTYPHEGNVVWGGRR